MFTRLELHPLRLRLGALALAGSTCMAVGCRGGGTGSAPADAAKSAAGAVTTPAPPADEPLAPTAQEAALPEGVRAHLFETFTGDLDQMVARRMIRVGHDHDADTPDRDHV